MFWTMKVPITDVLITVQTGLFLTLLTSVSHVWTHVIDIYIICYTCFQTRDQKQFLEDMEQL